MTSQYLSLRKDFEFLISDNGLSGFIQIDDELVDNAFQFETEFLLNISKRYEKNSEHGTPNIGTVCKNAEEASEDAAKNVEKLFQQELGNINNGLSVLLKAKSDYLTLSSGVFYVIHNCRVCSTKGKIACDKCGAEGQWTCEKCSGDGETPCTKCNAQGQLGCENCDSKGKVNCYNCHGIGRKKCIPCDGRGKITEIYPSDADNHWDSYVKNTLGGVDRTCSHCVGGDVNCVVCNGYKKLDCSSCVGRGITTCDNCNGNQKTTCSTCSGGGIVTCDTCGGSTTITCVECNGFGHNSDITTKIVELKSTHHIANLSNFNALKNKCISRSYDDFLAGSQFESIEEKDIVGKKNLAWRVLGRNKYENLSVSTKNDGDFHIGRFSSVNDTVSATGCLDETLFIAASTALSTINSISEFKEKAPQLPGILRWAFGEKVQSATHAVVRPMYGGLLSESGVENIRNLKNEYLQKVSKKLFWKLLFVTVPTSLAIMFVLFEFFLQQSAVSQAAQVISVAIALAVAYGAAVWIAGLYTSHASKL